MKNLYQNTPKDLPNELFETLIKTDNVHIERIVSKGHTSPKEGWYDQRHLGSATFGVRVKTLHVSGHAYRTRRC